MSKLDGTKGRDALQWFWNTVPLNGRLIYIGICSSASDLQVIQIQTPLEKEYVGMSWGRVAVRASCQWSDLAITLLDTIDTV